MSDAALSSARESFGPWQPMETAPKDEGIFVWIEEWNMHAAAWFVDDHWWIPTPNSPMGCPPPSRWMPLPEPPAPASTESEA